MQDNFRQLKRIFITTLGEVVKAERTKQHKSIYQISAEASVPRSTWRDLEFGKSLDINLSNFCKISEGLNILPHELLKKLTEKLGKDFSFTDLNS